MPKSFDWAFGPGTSPVMGAINAAGSALAITMPTSLAGAGDQPLWALTGGVAAAGIAAISSATKDQPGVVAAYRAVCWLGGGAWASYALATYDAAHPLTSGPWNFTTIGVLGVLGAAAAGIGTILRSATRSLLPSGRLRVGSAAKTKEEWLERIRRVAHLPGASIAAGPEWWPGGYGFTLEVILGVGGATWKTLAARVEALEADAALPIGCGLEVSPGATKDRAIVRIALADALGDERLFPKDIPPRSINDDLSIGWHRDSSDIDVNIRWTSLIMAGEKDSGKTNTLHAITARVAQCTDTLIFMIAIAKKGAVAEPWNRAFKEGRAEHPIVDRVAVTEAQADLMCDIIDDAIDGRIEKLVPRMRAADDDKVPVGYSDADELFVPEIVLIVDEFAQLPDRIKRRVTSIAETGRGSSVTTVTCSQRATSEHFPASLKKQSRIRIGMRVTDPEELNYLLGWNKKIPVEDLTHKGSTIVGDGSGAVRPGRIFRMIPSLIDRIAVTCGATGRRPGLERGTLSPAMQAAYDGWVDEDVERSAGNARAARSTSVSVKEVTAQAQDLTTRLRQRAEEIAAARTNPAAEVAALNELWGLPAAQPARTEPQAATDPRERMMQLLAHAGPTGSGSTQLAAQLRAEGHPTSRQTVAGWLAEELIKGTITQPGGPKTPYIHPTQG